MEIHIHNDEKPRKIQHTDIEYFTSLNGSRGYSWDFLTGCRHWQTGVCGGGKDFRCWAKALAEGRLKRFFPYGFEPTLYPSRLLDPFQIKTPSRIAVCFKGDLFGDWVNQHQEISLPNLRPGMTKSRQLQWCVQEVIRNCPQHTFLFLTKNPSGYLNWGEFPDNCWCGVTTTGLDRNSGLEDALGNVRAKNKFLSIEPLLDYSPMDFRWVKWVIVGGFSGGHRAPRIEWVQSIVEAADKAGIPVWLKNNLRPLFTQYPPSWAFRNGDLRQEMPRVK